MRRIIAFLSKVTMGLMLVGCSTIPGLKLGQRDADPLATIQSGATGNERIAAYRELATVHSHSPERRAQAHKILVEGATQEYNVLARAAAVASLAAYDEPDVIEILLKAANDRNPIVRVEACRALAERNEMQASDTLKQLATADADPDVRMAAAGALIHKSDPSTVDALVECLKDEEFAVARRAADGLRSMTGASINSDDYTDWNSWVQQNPQFNAVRSTAAKPDRSGFFDLIRR